MSNETTLQAQEKTNAPGQHLTPLFANSFNIVVTGVTTRITLGELIPGRPPEETHFHTTFSAPTVDAINLAKLILNLCEQNADAKKLMDALEGKAGQ